MKTRPSLALAASNYTFSCMAPLSSYLRTEQMLVIGKIFFFFACVNIPCAIFGQSLKVNEQRSRYDTNRKYWGWRCHFIMTIACYKIV